MSKTRRNTSAKKPTEKKPSTKTSGRPRIRPVPKRHTNGTKKKGDKDDCFLTTACVTYFGMSDKCHELETLRSFRDSILKKNDSGRMMVKHYELVAPQIVTMLKSDPNRNSEFERILKQIQRACDLIQKEFFVEAKAVYISEVLRLMNKYSLS